MSLYITSPEARHQGIFYQLRDTTFHSVPNDSANKEAFLLEPVVESNLNEALSLLCRGFPHRPKSFWQSGVDRLNAMNPSNQGWPIGYLLAWKGRYVGVLLTFASQQRMTSNGRPVVNLSSWYVEEKCRWLAPMMLKRLPAAQGAVFTDLTPSPTVAKMVLALGFSEWMNGGIVALTPRWTFGDRTSVIEPLHRAPPDACLALRRLMDDHAAADCIVGVLCHAGGEEPMIFQRRRFKGFRGAELIFAPNRHAVISHFSAVARFLAQQKVFLLRIDVSEDESWPPGLFVRRNRQAKYFKGDMDSKSTDYAYSELVYFDLKC